MNRIFIAKNELENKAIELKGILGLGEVEIYLAMQGALMDLSNQLATKLTYENRAKDVEIEHLTKHNQELCDILNAKKGDDNGTENSKQNQLEE